MFVPGFVSCVCMGLRHSDPTVVLEMLQISHLLFQVRSTP